MDMPVVNNHFEAALRFKERLEGIRKNIKDVSWYPYDILASLWNLDGLLPEWITKGLTQGFDRRRVLDIGAADGDLGYLFESKGCKVDFLDNEQTNYNRCTGIRALSKALKSKSTLILKDVDRGFELRRDYDLAICLGILYHLRNPMLILMELAQRAESMVLSTRIATNFPGGAEMGPYRCAYFLHAGESNNDNTNYWTLSPAGLEELLKRSGWIVKAKKIVGASPSNPVDNDADARMFVYCERTPRWRELYVRHNF